MPPSPARTVTAGTVADMVVVAIRPSFVRVAELIEEGTEVDWGTCATPAGLSSPALVAMTLSAAVVVVAPTRPFFGKVAELIEEEDAVAAVAFPTPAITAMTLPAALVVVAPICPSFVKLLAPAAATVAFPPSPAMTHVALSAAPVVVALTKPSFMRIVELIAGGGLETGAAAAWPCAGSPLALTATAAAMSL